MYHGTRRLEKFRSFQDFARRMGDFSTCKRASVGSIVFPEDFSQVLSIGYNGPPAGSSHDLCTNEPGQCGCVHAEANALVKLPERTFDAVMYCTTCPCVTCAGLIVNLAVMGKIDKLVYGDAYRNERGLDILRACSHLRTYTLHEYYDHLCQRR